MLSLVVNFFLCCGLVSRLLEKGGLFIVVLGLFMLVVLKFLFVLVLIVSGLSKVRLLLLFVF